MAGLGEIASSFLSTPAGVVVALVVLVAGGLYVRWILKS